MLQSTANMAEANTDEMSPVVTANEATSHHTEEEVHEADVHGRMPGQITHSS
jgi:hypothetical protein